jgi:hypothetical protein
LLATGQPRPRTPQRGGPTIEHDDFDSHVDDADPEAWARTGRGVKEWRAGHALRMWRGHAAMLARPAYDAQRGAYERAIAFGLARLQGIDTFDGLIAHYFDHRHDNRRGRYEGGRPINPAPGTVERWVADALAWAGDPTLQPAIVEENAFWLRAKQVMLVATAR